MKRKLLVLGALLAGVSGTAAAHSDIGFSLSFGAPGAVYSAPPAYVYSDPYYYSYAQPYYAPPRVYYGDRDWRWHEYREHHGHWAHERSGHERRGEHGRR